MASHHGEEAGDTVVDSLRDWMIQRCSHGCFHVTLDRLMVTFTEDEFHSLQDLVRRAGRRLQPRRAVRGPVLRAH